MTENQQPELEVSIDFADLPEAYFIDPNDRPLGTLITFPSLVKKNYKGIRLRKTRRGATYTEHSNIVKILTKQAITGVILLGDENNLVHIDQDVKGDFHLGLWHNAQISIGKETTAIFLQVEIKRGIVSIGEQCMLSNIWIQASDMHGVWCLKTKKQLNQGGFNITIEDGVWLARACSIVRPVTIGKGSIVAFGAVVTKDVPPCSIAAGNPARITQRNVTWTRHLHNQLELNQHISSMDLEAELVNLNLSKLGWLNKISKPARKLQHYLLRRSKHHG